MSNRKQRRQTSGNQQVATAKDGFMNLAARMGVGAQNVLSDGTYNFNLLTRNRMKLEAMYRGSWIVGAAVDSVAEDMTRAGINIHATTEPEQVQQMQAMLTRLGVWDSLLETIKWGRLYGGAMAAIVIDGQDPSTPLNFDTIAKGQFKGLRVYDRWSLQPSLSDVIEDGIDVGLPKYYGVISDPNTGKVGNIKWHYSRIIRFIGIQLPIWQAITEMMWGESVIERMNDRLISFDTATAGAANLINKAHLRTVQIDKLREVLAAGGKAEENLLQMFHHMRMLQVNEGITLLDKEDSFQAFSYTFSGLSDMILQFGQQIAGATGIPLVRLFGQSPAGLNSTGESDLRMYYDNIRAQQESRLRDGMMRIIRVLHRSMFQQPAPEALDFDFVSLWQTSEKEKVDIANTVTTLVTTAFEKGVIDQATALQELKQSSDTTGVFTNITDEKIEEAKMAPPPSPIEAAPLPEDPAAPADSKSLMQKLKDWVNG